jgi:low affinity Fe/Cu permease
MLGRWFLRLSPRARREIAIWMVDASVVVLVVGPFLSFAVAFLVVLELSIFAITLTAVDWLTNTDIRQQQEEEQNNE